MPSRQQPITLLRFVPYLAAAMVLICFYGYVRSQREAERAFSLYENGQLVDAQQALRSALLFSPGATWQGQQLTMVAARLEQAIEALERRVEVPLPPNASDPERLVRARNLAMLNRRAEARAILDDSATLADTADAHQLRGVMDETQGAFAPAAMWYAQAQAAWQAQEESAPQQAGLTAARKGQALCARKLGRLAEAEQHYQAVLRHSPTAAAHFLVAQFYEDAQQVQRSQYHALQAMQLDPERYAEPGQRLIDKLMTSHFGCWSIASSP